MVKQLFIPPNVSPSLVSFAFAQCEALMQSLLQNASAKRKFETSSLFTTLLTTTTEGRTKHTALWTLRLSLHCCCPLSTRESEKKHPVCCQSRLCAFFGTLFFRRLGYFRLSFPKEALIGPAHPGHLHAVPHSGGRGQGGPHVQVREAVIRPVHGASVVVIYDVANLPIPALHDPVVPVKRQLVPAEQNKGACQRRSSAAIFGWGKRGSVHNHHDCNVTRKTTSASTRSQRQIRAPPPKFT